MKTARDRSRAASFVARLVDLANVLRREAFRPTRHLERHLIPVREALEAVALDRGVVDEYVLALTLRDEAETLRLVEPLHGSCVHCISFLQPRQFQSWSNAVRRDGRAPVQATGFRVRGLATIHKRPSACCRRP